MPSSNGSLILPLVLWNDMSPVECQITSMLLNETEKLMFTGTNAGHIIMWEFSVDDVSQ
jgi:hypothetical protein